MQAKNVVTPLIFLTAAAAIGFLVYQNARLKQQALAPSSAASPPTASITPSPAASSPAPGPSASPITAPKAGWKIYRNEQYGFEFSCPEAYKILTDETNLYGWPRSILLLYKGGQSYNLTVEVWGSAQSDYDLNVKLKDGRFIALKNLNHDPEVAEIIATFKLTD